MPTKQQLDELSESIESMQDPSALLHIFYDDLENVEEDQLRFNSVLFDLCSKQNITTIDLSEDDYEIIE